MGVLVEALKKSDSLKGRLKRLSLAALPDDYEAFFMVSNCKLGGAALPCLSRST